MPNTLSGADISNYQKQINWSIFKNNVNFVISKATEGVGFIDPQFENNRQQSRKANILRGYYAFARPDLNNKAEDEANFFINVINKDPLQEGENIFLDYEVQFNGDAVTWVKTWMDIVEETLKVKPIFYSYQSMLSQYDWSPIINNGNGLWVAAPTNPTNPQFTTGKWQFAAFCQWGTQNIPGIDGQVDSDIFFGDANMFKAYGYHAPVVIPPPDPCLVYKQQIESVTSAFEQYKKDHPVQFSTITPPVTDPNHVDETQPANPNLPIARSAFEQIVDSFVHWWNNRN